MCSDVPLPFRLPTLNQTVKQDNSTMEPVPAVAVAIDEGNDEGDAHPTR